MQESQTTRARTPSIRSQLECWICLLLLWRLDGHNDIQRQHWWMVTILGVYCSIYRVNLTVVGCRVCTNGFCGTRKLLCGLLNFIATTVDSSCMHSLHACITYYSTHNVTSEDTWKRTCWIIQRVPHSLKTCLRYISCCSKTLLSIKPSQVPSLS